MSLQLASTTITMPEDRSNSKKRGLLLFSIFIFPILLSSLVFLLVVLISDINFNTVGVKTDYAEIITPKNQSSVGNKFKISGSLNTPLENHSYYLLEYREKNYWPKYSLGNKQNIWNKELTNRAKKNAFTSFQVIMADEKLAITIESWFKKAHETGQYPGIRDLNIKHMVANLRVQKQ